MKRILSLLLTLLMLTALFASCGTQNPTPAEFYSNYGNESDYILNTAEALTALSPKNCGSTLGIQSDTIIPFEYVSSNEIAVDIYNLEQNKIVHSFTYAKGGFYLMEKVSVFGNECFTIIQGKVDSKEGRSTSLYTQNGELIAKAEGVHVYDAYDYLPYFVSAQDTVGIDVIMNLIRFDNTVYQISEDGSVKELIAKSSFASFIPRFDFYNGEYYIDYTQDDTPEFVVYDNSLEVVFHWKYDRMLSGNYDHNLFILNDGPAVFQLNEALPDDAKKYDILINGTKHNLTALLINPKNGSEKNLQPDFIIESTLPLDEYNGESNTLRKQNGISEKYENIAFVRYIKDGTLSTTARVALTNQCKLQCELFTDLPLIDSDVTPISDDLFVYTTVTGTAVFINGKGEKIVEMHAAVHFDMKHNRRYIVIDNCIYDHSFNTVYDFGADGYTLYKLMSEGMILSKDGDYYFCKDTTTSLIVTDEDINRYLYTAHPDYYAVYDSMAYECTYFNARGEKLFSLDSRVSIRNNAKGYLLFEGHDQKGNFLYYRVSK